MTIEQRLDAVATKAIEGNRIVGTVLIVRKDGDVLYEKAHGLADRDAGRPMTLDAIFRLSSLTKPIIAATILALHDAGHVRISDPVTEYLPWFRPRLADGREPVITLNHLLTHTAGVAAQAPDWTEAEKAEPKYQAIGLNRFHLSLEDNVRRLAQEPLLFEPGSAWTYSQATDVLGLVAATAESSEGVLGTVVENLGYGPPGHGRYRLQADRPFAAGDGVWRRFSDACAHAGRAWDTQSLWRHDPVLFRAEYSTGRTTIRVAAAWPAAGRIS